MTSCISILDTMTPTKIGRYEIIDELGRGGMATVYRAHDPTFEREVAVKVLPQELQHDTQFRARFEREAKMIAKLEHAAIVPVYDVGTEDGQPYFVMRYMTGGSLADRMKAGLIPLAETNRISMRLCAALDYAHSKGIVHRDLKPGNILFDDAGDPYISDYGIAKFSQAETHLTTDGSIVGTPAYMSPEQGQGNEIDRRSDLYSMAVILFEMLTGRTPYEANTPLGLVFKHVSDPIPHLLDIRADLPAGLEPIIEKALAKKPEDRFNTCSDFASAVDAVLRGETPDINRTDPGKTRFGASSVEMDEAKSGGTKKATLPVPIWAVAVGGVLLLAIVAFLIFGLGGNKNLPVATEPTEAAAESSAPVEATTISTEELTATPEPELGVGGADKIAFISKNNIYVMDVDGSNLVLLTTDGKPKNDLRWAQDGNSLLYLDVESRCIRRFALDASNPENINCFVESPYPVAFDLSPDGTQIAIVFGRELFILPLDAFRSSSRIESRTNLTALNGCLTLSTMRIENVRWAAGDGTRLILQVKEVVGSVQNDLIRIMDVSNCAAPFVVDEFPGKRFLPIGYNDNPSISSFSWDGKDLFLISTFKRNGGFGELYSYDTGTNIEQQMNPINGTCCYRDASFSPDGTYILFVFQDQEKGPEAEIELYYLPVDQLNDPESFVSLSVPLGFFPNQRDKPQPVLRPAQP